MTYATQQDLIDSFGLDELKRVADRDNDGALDAAVVARALADVDAEIDAYLRPVYALPLAVVPLRLKRLAADLALYALYPSNPPEDVRKRRSDARAFLLDIAAGRAGLEVAGLPPAPAGGGQVAHQAPERVFTRDGLKGF
jgi:phage gp36-like protein